MARFLGYSLPVIKYAVRLMIGMVTLVLFWSCTSVPGVNDESATPVIRVPFVRVLLSDNLERATIDADGALALECIDKGKQTIFYSAQHVEVMNVGGRLRIENNRGAVIQEGVEEANFLPRGSGSHVRFSQKRFRGIIKVLPYGRNVRLINVVYMEDYLRGVVPPEIGPRDENEIDAIKAQAVERRTYAVGHLQQYSGEPYDMKSTVADQLYEGMESENRLVNRAVEETAGDVAMFHDNFINAYYHSTCGGLTDDISQVWDKPAQPYLVPVDDNASCSWSKYFSWQEQFTEEQLRGRLEQYLSSDRGRQINLSRITDIAIRERTAGGRVAKLIVRTKDDNYRFYKDRIRWAIGRASNPELILPSDKFEVEISSDDQGNISTILFKGNGYGHGVGMCQCGAIGFARNGWRYDQILERYYSGMELKKLY